MGEGVVIHDSQGKIIDANPAAERILDIPREKLLRQDASAWESFCFQEDGSSFPLAEFPPMITLRTGRPCRDNVVMIRPSAGAESRWLLLNAEPAGSGDSTPPVAVIVSFSDITRLKKSQEDLHRLHDRLELMVWAGDLGYTDWNLATDEMIFNRRFATLAGGILSEIKPTGQAWKEHIHPNDLPRVLQRLQTHCAGKTPSFEVEYRFRTPSGHWCWLLNRGKVVERSPDNRPLRIVGYHKDITDRKRLEEHTIQNAKMDAVGLLAGGIAHDFNNLLTAIKGNLQLLSLDVPPENPSIEYVRDAITASQRASDLAQRLLTFSRNNVPSKEVLNLGKIVREITRLTLTGSNCEAEITEDGDLPCVHADPAQLTQVFNNLLLNAIQAMPQGGPISILIENQEIKEDNPYLVESRHYLRVSIRDHGAGIPPENLPNIFEPYFTTKPDGTGLGLSSVLSIVKKHGGFLAVESTPGQGTTMRVHLPVFSSAAPKPSSAEPQATAAIPTKPTPKSAPANEKILVMDDEAPIQRILVRWLGQAGIAADSVSNGEAALEKFEAERETGSPYTMLILDLTVRGGMGGETVIRRLKEIDPTIKSIVISGYSNNPAMSDPKKFGFDAVVSKPFTGEKILETVRRLRSGA
jgi:PAS domain S-box-containing protein